jgi:Maltogenic Amylase, C-terminal domain
LNMTLVAIKDNPEKQRLAAAIVATTGQFISDWSHKDDKLASDREIQWLLKMKAAHPALHQMGQRRKLPTNDDSKYYAFIRTAPGGTERVLIVSNFWATGQEVLIDTSGLHARALTDLRSGEKISLDNRVQFNLPAFGYRLFEVE